MLGCVEAPLSSSQANAELRKILAGDFVLSSIPSAQKEEFHLVLAAFAKTRKPTEFVREVTINEAMDEASVAFTFEGGIHRGGYAFLKKKGGIWIVAETYYST